MNYSFKQNRESVEFVINDLCGNTNLNEWETNFVHDIRRHYITENKFLTDNQMKRLSDMWEKY